MNEADRRWMQHALELAEYGRGFVEPNPLVGAVVVRNDQLVGEGWHERYGQAHAEVNALAAAGDAARGATLYVTLEPCCHRGKTPPCTAAILQAGIQRVVAAMLDPFPQVAGQGFVLLRAAGVAVEIDVALDQARRLNAPYLKLLAIGRPYIHAKWAMSLDGKIATRTGDSRWISSAASRERAHTLRVRMDAIIIGAGTARRDDPLLTARPPGRRTPVRIVLGSSAALAPSSQLVKTARAAPVLVANAEDSDSEDADRLRQAGCEILNIPAGNRATQVELLLDELGRRRMTNVLVEGGAGVLGSFCDARALDEVHVFVAPLLLGGAESVSALAGKGADSISAGLKLENWDIEAIGGDWLVHARVRREESK